MASRLKFGIYLPSFSSKLEAGDLYDYNLRAAKLVEQRGMDSIWAVDHLHAFDSVEKVGRSMNILESMCLLSALASATSRVSVGTSVLSVPFRNPALLAKMAATLDIISNGRLILGVGAGWRKDEFEGFGFKWENTQTRLRMTIEAIDLIKRFWTEDRVDHEGRFYRTKGGQLWPKPVQRPRPKIWFGGVGFKAMGLAKHVDGWVAPPLHIEDLKVRLNMIRDWGVRESGFEVGYELFTSVAPNRDDAFRDGKQSLERWFGDPIEDVNNFETEVQLPHGIVVRYGAVVGNADDCVDRIIRFAEAGVSHFELHFMPLEGTTEGVNFYADKVIPSLREHFDR